MLLTPEKAIWRNTTIIGDNVLDAVRALKAAPGRNILSDGSRQLVQELLAHHSVDELHLLMYPLAVGGGKRPFPANVLSKSKLGGVVTFPSGVVKLRYTLSAE